LFKELPVFDELVKKLTATVKTSETIGRESKNCFPITESAKICPKCRGLIINDASDMARCEDNVKECECECEEDEEEGAETVEEAVEAPVRTLPTTPVRTPSKPKTKPTTPLKPTPGIHPKPKAKRTNKDVELFLKNRGK